MRQQHESPARMTISYDSAPDAGRAAAPVGTFATSGQGAPVQTDGIVQRFWVNAREALRAVFTTHRSRVAGPRPALAKPGRVMLGTALALIAIVGLMLYFDAFSIAQQRGLPRWFVSISSFVSDAGQSRTVLIPIGIVLVALALTASPHIGRTHSMVLGAFSARLGFLFIAIGLPGLLVTVGKRLIGRMRPNAQTLTDPLAFSPWSWDSALASLPSGHATTAFGMAVAFGALFPRWRWALWIVAICIAGSRVVVSMHYPSDVVAGALCGVLGALLIRNWFAARRLVFSVGEGGVVRATPGPSRARLMAAFRALSGRKAP